MNQPYDWPLIILKSELLLLLSTQYVYFPAASPAWGIQLTSVTLIHFLKLIK